VTENYAHAIFFSVQHDKQKYLLINETKILSDKKSIKLCL